MVTTTQPTYGLAGAEQALMQANTGGINALTQGSQQGVNALNLGNQQGMNTLLAGNQFAQQQLNQGQQALGGDFGVTAASVDPTTGLPLFQQASQAVGQYSPAGIQAQNLQSALSGAQGQQAFDQAFINSPIQQFLQQQGTEAIANQAAASGGLGSGEFQKDLAAYGQGIAGQQLQQQIDNLSALSSQGLQAAGQQGTFLSQAGQQQGDLASQNAQLSTQANIASANNALNAATQSANLYGQGAGISSDLASQGANLQYGTGQNVANLLSGTGQDIASLLGSTGTNLADARFQTGTNLASQIGQSTSALSDLANQQGTGLTDIIGQGGSNLANLLSGAGQAQSSQSELLATLLSNLAIGEGTQAAEAQQALGQAEAGGITGSADAIAGTTMDIAQIASMFSDERLKTNIKKIDTKKGVNIYSWDWNGVLGLAGKAKGVIAQEVENVIPNAVFNTHKGYKAVRYDIVEDYINAII